VAQAVANVECSERTHSRFVREIHFGLDPFRIQRLLQNHLAAVKMGTFREKNVKSLKLHQLQHSKLAADRYWRKQYR
jgi:hypothetical protein